jgi:hypothetical protein
VNNVIPSALIVKSIVLSLNTMNHCPKKCIYMMLIAGTRVHLALL